MQRFISTTPWPRSLLGPFGIIVGLAISLIITLVSDTIGLIVLLEVGSPLLGILLIWIGRYFTARRGDKGPILLPIFLIILGGLILSFGLFHIAWFIYGID